MSFSSTEPSASEVIAAYSERPSYAPSVIDQILSGAGTETPRVADIGAGTGNLTLELLARRCFVDAVEPHRAMREAGVVRTSGYSAIQWHDGYAEATGLPSHIFDAVTFGSSYEFTSQVASLHEAARILRKGGLLACIWIRRLLDDPLQLRVQALLQSFAPEYHQHKHAWSHRDSISSSGLFGQLMKIEGIQMHRTTLHEWMNAWRSHEPSRRQVGDNFGQFLVEIERLTIEAMDGDYLLVPYKTTGWLAVCTDH